MTFLQITRFLAFLALALTCSPAAAETWHRADTRNFIIYSNGSQSLLEDFATSAEMFDALFREYFSLPSEPPPNRLTIYVLKDSDDVSELAGDGDRTLAGFYRTSSDGSFAVSNRERGRGRTDMTGQTVLFHEYVHHLMARYFTFGYPPWYREGFAEFFATATFEDDGDWTLGEPANHRAVGLRRVNLPLEQVLFGDLQTMSPSARDAYYGKSWLLVHLTVFNPERRDQLLAYLSRLGSDEEPRDAFAATFGDLEVLEDELEDYLRGRISSLVSQSPISMAGEVRIETLDEVRSQLLPLSLLRRVGREKQATRDALRELAASHPDRAEILAELALAEHALAETQDEPDYTATHSAIEAALALAPNNAEANLLKAGLWMEALSDNAGATNSDWEQLRELVQSVNSAAPSDPRPLVMRYETYLREGQQPSVEVVNGLGEALMLTPEAIDIRVNLAWALANENVFDDAIALIEFLVSDPHSGGAVRSVLDAIIELQDRRRGHTGG